MILKGEVVARTDDGWITLPETNQTSPLRLANGFRFGPVLRMLPGVNGTACSAYPACVAVGMKGQCCPNTAKVGR